MTHHAHDDGIDFGHEFHGREHHFVVTRAALEYLDGGVGLDEAGLLKSYNEHLKRIHRAAEARSRNVDAIARIVLDRDVFEA